jgi:hypothetical protein
MTDEQRLELVLLEYRTASRPEIRHYDPEVVEDHFAYLIAQGLLERKHGKPQRFGTAPVKTVLSATGQQRLDTLKELAG